MYDADVRRVALTAIRSGQSISAVSRATGVSRAALRSWRDGTQVNRTSDCPRCGPDQRKPAPDLAYTYLLGQYLGDGTLSRGRGDVWSLRIACADSWPAIMTECTSAVRALRPLNSVSHLRRQGCTYVTARWKHWPCLFPQHGPGMKHTRPIVLEPWQDDLVAEHTGAFLRGLFHSDGCRMTNWTRRTVAGVPRRYEYPRWFFTNKSADILGLCSAALDRLDIAHRFPRPDTISVARREAVAALDAAVGPKA
ncbi:hypothetical protein FHX44_116041 [Pseudonocardia hierapolitana]|uniref:Transcriptional regulator n=1 Tax=Pseudonocardia hierapolitana TaxID=1128676 RepID=A0A561SZ22_9PSEU|nr:transcriptional regulator [Pseudonocardia hierapolitana]TWF80104.1 hypothetical protein FHX44_116041 [Pseudonocardia hierapolitana]